MIKTLFFGHLPLGWKRLFRGITFAWCTCWGIAGFPRYTYSNGDLNTGAQLFLVGLFVSMLLSFIISGFILQSKKD